MKIRRLIGCCLMAFMVPGAFAADISMRGFASIVAGQSLESEEEIYGYEGRLDTINDSIAAIQFNADLGDGLSATVQMMARGSNDFKAVAEWAYLTYEFSESVQLSAGRMRIPFYYYSDYLDVRYTYPWIKVPQTVYGFEFPGYDGLSLVITSAFGTWDSTLQLVFGQLNGELPSAEARVRSENFGGFNWTVTRDWLTLRAGYMESHTSIAIDDFDGVVQLIQGVGAGFMVDTSELVSGIVVEDDAGSFGGLAMAIDYDDWLFSVEYVTYGVDNSATATTDAYYVMFGKRIDKYTPYFTYSNQKGEADDEIYGLIPAAIANFPIAQAGGATITQLLGAVTAGSAADTDLMLLGLRYDFHPSAAFKAEYLQQEDISGEVTDLIRVGVDLVF